MSTPEPEEGEEAAAKPRRKIPKLALFVGGPVIGLLVVGGGLWFTGILPSMLGMGPKPEAAVDTGPKPVVFVDLPEIVSNLNTAGKRPAFVKLKAKLELARAEDEPVVAADLPRVLDMLQTYLRETRPEELRGAAGTWRLRREMVARADIAVAPAHVNDLLFTEMLVQ